MAKQNQPSEKGAEPGLSDQADYEVGYGKPPKETQFKPGQSGNPRGRPKGSANKVPALNEERLKSIILEEAYRSIEIKDGDRPVNLPMVQAILRSMAVKAVRGDQRAQDRFTELLAITEKENNRLYQDLVAAAVEYKLNWEKELRLRELTGASGPEYDPHPDDIVLDYSRGCVGR